MLCSVFSRGGVLRAEVPCWNVGWLVLFVENGGDGSHRMSRSVLSLALSTLCTLAQSFKKKKLQRRLIYCSYIDDHLTHTYIYIYIYIYIIRCEQFNCTICSHPHPSHTCTFFFFAECQSGFFKSSVSSEACKPCPKNTQPSGPGATSCTCKDGFYRAPEEPKTAVCSGEKLLLHLTCHELVAVILYLRTISFLCHSFL